MLQWTWGCMYFSELVFSFSSDKYPEVELLGHMVALLYYWFSEKPLYCSPQRLYQFTFPQTGTSVPFSPHPHQHMLFLAFLIIVILIGVWWYLIVALICISLMINNVECLFMLLLDISMSYLEKCLLDLLPIF